MAANDLLLQLVIKAVDLATKDIDGVHDKLETLKKALTGNEFDRSAEGMQAFGQAVKDSTEPLAAAAKNTLALSAAVTGVASYLAGNAYKSAKEYESALADLAKVLDGGKEEAKAYGEELNKLALKYGQNGQELVAAMANFVQAGYDAKSAFDLVEQSVKLKIAGDIEAAQSSEYLISILKGFKAPASEAASTVDLLNEVSNKYATDVKQLAIGMAGISPIAKQMGFSMSETAGMLTPIIEVYGSGSEAADALKTGLLRLQDTADPVVAALGSIGVSQLDLNGKLRSGKDIFLDVAKAMTGLDDAQKQFVTAQLVGIDQAGRMSQVFSNLSGYLGATDAALNSTGSALKEVESRLDTAEAKGKRAEESFRQLSVTLGNTFKPQIAGVIGATGDLAAAFDKAVKSGDLAPLLNVIKPQIAAVENLFSAMAANLDQALDGVDWTPLVDGIKAFSGEFGQAVAALTDGMDLTTVEGLRNLLQALINMMGNFSQYVAGVVDGLKPFMASLNALFGAISTNLPTFSNLAGQITGLATSANQVIPVITSLGSGIFGAIGSVVDLTLKIGLFVGGLKLLSAVGIPVGEVLGGLAARFLALNPAVAGLLSSLAGLPGLVAGLTAAAGGLGYALGTVVNKTVEWVSGGQSIGTMLYDLVHGSDDAEKSINRVATAEERAAAAANIKAAAERAKREEEEKSLANAKALADASTDKSAKSAEEAAAIERLKARYTELGLVWTPLSAELASTNRQMMEHKVATLELGTALDKVGVDASVMSNRMTQAGEGMLKTLNGIANNAQASGKEVNAAILKMIPKMETQAELTALRSKIEQFGREGKLSFEQVAAALELVQGRSSELARDPALEQIVNKAEKAAQKAKDYTSALEDVAEAQLDGIRAERDRATALGATALAQQKAVELAKAEAEWAKIVAAAKQIEIAAEQALLQAKIEQLKSGGLQTEADKQQYAGLQLQNAALGLQADAVKKSAEAKDLAAKQAGLTTQATQQSTEATQADTVAQEQNNQAKDDGMSMTKLMNAALDGARERTKALSEATGVLFEKYFLGMNQMEPTAFSAATEVIRIGLDKVKDKHAEVRAEIVKAGAASDEASNKILFGANSIIRFFAYVEKAEADAKQAYYTQKLAAEELIDSLGNIEQTGAASFGSMGAAMHTVNVTAQTTIDSLNLLNDEDLSNLNSALDRAKQKLQELQDEANAARDRLSELNAELAREQGDTDTADQLELELAKRQALAEVEANLAKARAANNRDLIALYEAQLAKEQQLYDLKEKNLKRDQEEARSSNRTETTTHTTITSGSAGVSSPTINVNVNASNARLLDSRFKEELARDLKPIFDDLHRRLQ
ncbi:membrane hypothetical protein [Candidatus Competibacter denitrificans Run_A_D11]|uniref:Phage tail tape measure protein domain-containing protein n=1 Tax=Candidatus Competibacter denitrificans Run_A_D11 TaxID=1400863 RepID=W6M823_9GAMM|nr:phage tail tape measure protein [Candidatus Competibacter denitrificans]CDI04096.1 membrane hypothetical protein [Candidatus Competibacter denitrificans Run_A_D11]